LTAPHVNCPFEVSPTYIAGTVPSYMYT